MHTVPTPNITPVDYFYFMYNCNLARSHHLFTFVFLQMKIFIYICSRIYSYKCKHMDSSISDRIFRLIDALDISVANFSDETGIDRASLSHIKNERSKPTLEMIRKIVSSYPQVSLDWLILGGGTMLKQSDNPQEPDLFTQIAPSNSISVNKPTKTPSISVQTKTDNEIIGANSAEDTDQTTPPGRPATSHIKKILIFYSDNTYEEIIR